MKKLFSVSKYYLFSKSNIFLFVLSFVLFALITLTFSFGFEMNDIKNNGNKSFAGHNYVYALRNKEDIVYDSSNDVSEVFQMNEYVSTPLKINSVEIPYSSFRIYAIENTKFPQAFYDENMKYSNDELLIKNNDDNNDGVFVCFDFFDFYGLDINKARNIKITICNSLILPIAGFVNNSIHSILDNNSKDIMFLSLSLKNKITSYGYKIEKTYFFTDFAKIISVKSNLENKNSNIFFYSSNNSTMVRLISNLYSFLLNLIIVLDIVVGVICCFIIYFLALMDNEKNNNTRKLLYNLGFNKKEIIIFSLFSISSVILIALLFSFPCSLMLNQFAVMLISSNSILEVPINYYLEFYSFLIVATLACSFLSSYGLIALNKNN